MRSCVRSCVEPETSQVPSIVCACASGVESLADKASVTSDRCLHQDVGHAQIKFTATVYLMPWRARKKKTEALFALGEICHMEADSRVIYEREPLSEILHHFRSTGHK